MRCWKLRKGRLPIGPSSDGASENVDSLHTPDLLDRSCSLFDSSCGLHQTTGLSDKLSIDRSVVPQKLGAVDQCPKDIPSGIDRIARVKPGGEIIDFTLGGLAVERC